ncbi:MAG: hypothetical protein V3V67_13365 [Myxococcota bacterium]
MGAFAAALAVILLFGSSRAGKSESAAAERAPLETPVAIEIARIELSPRAEPEPPPPTGPDAGVLRRGSALLRAGSFPRLRATYVRIGFAAYREAVVELGGAFYLYDARARQALAEVDPLSGRLRAEGVREELSRWPRDVTRHLPDALRRGRERYGSRVSRVVLLPPASLDAALLGALDQHLRELGLDADGLLRVDVAYELRGDRLQCEVLSVALRDGSERELGLRIDLTAVGTGGPGGRS